MSRYENELVGLLNGVVHYMRVQPLYLGGASSSGGGSGGPPGGFVGFLPQNRVTYDFSEAETWYTPASGYTLLDNLNHIRWRLSGLEASGVGGASSLVITDEGVVVSSGITVINFGTNLTATETVPGEVTIAALDTDTGHVIQEEGTPLTQRNNLNFIGTAVTATDNAVNDATDITIVVPTAGHAIKDEGGAALTQRANLNFVGAGVAATDDAGGDATVITVTSPTAGHVIKEEGGAGLTQRTNLNFIGTGVTATDNAATDSTDITIVVSGGSSGHTIQEEGTPLTARTNLNFVGTGVTVTDDVGNDASVVTISGLENNIFIDQNGSETYTVLSGDVNGVNTLFGVSSNVYTAGKLSVFLNGQLLTPGSGRDWVETDPTAGTFTLNTAPELGDIVTAQFLAVAGSTGDSYPPDWIFDPDVPPTATGTYDDEFTTNKAADGNAPTGWTAINMHSATAKVSQSNLIFWSPSDGGDNCHLLVKDFTGTPTFTTKVELLNPVDVYLFGGLVLREAGTSKLEYLSLWIEGGAIYFNIRNHADEHSGGSSLYSLGKYYTPVCVYLRAKIDASHITWYYSYSGHEDTFIQLYQEDLNANFTTAPDQAGLFLGTYDKEGGIRVDWFRST